MSKPQIFRVRQELGQVFLTEKEVAAILKCTRQHVNKLIKERSLLAVDIAASGMQRHCWRVSDAEYSDS